MELQDKILLSVQDLTLAFQSKQSNTEVVHGISFSVKEGEIIGIVGESGSGKSVTSLSLLSLLANSGRITQGEIKYKDLSLSSMSEKDLEKIRGKEISYVFQEPMTSLNPVLTIGYQLEEMLILHEKLSKEERKQRILEMLYEVELQDGEQILGKYPHQLSGGMRQRVMIAMAMLLRPRLLIADEPTTALDVTVQIKILELLRKLNKEFHTSIILISHDLAVIKSICSRVMVMYQGHIIEQGTIAKIFTNPEEEYTKKLLEAALLAHTDSERVSACSNSSISDWKEEDTLVVEDLCVYYPETKLKLFGKIGKKEIVHHVSFSMKKGEILGIVGESGCGKSTMAKALAGLIKDISGRIHMDCKQPQMVFQDPYSSLNPAKKIGCLLEEPLLLSKSYTKQERKDKVEEMLYKVGLTAEYANQYPANLSGGQRQRVAIAMAIMLNQEFIILDEPVSALDVTVQEQILELLLHLRKEYDLTYLFISHDMGVIQKICDRVGVMYQGELIELRETKELFEDPKEEYTKKLLNAILR